MTDTIFAFDFKSTFNKAHIYLMERRRNRGKQFLKIALGHCMGFHKS